MKKQTKRKAITLAALMAVAGLVASACPTPEEPGVTEEMPIGNVGGIPIYGFNSATAITNINNAYNDAKLDSHRNKLSAGIKKIYILEGNSATLYSFNKTTGVLTVGSDWTFGMYRDCFEYDVIPELSMKMLDNSRETVKMAIRAVNGRQKIS
jgi:hypothetical protein